MALAVDLVVAGSAIFAHVFRLHVPYTNGWDFIATSCAAVIPPIVAAYSGAGVHNLLNADASERERLY